MWPLNNLELIFVGIDQLLPIVVGLVLWIGLAGFGVLVAGRHATTEANVIFGWATISPIFTLVGVVQRAPIFDTYDSCGGRGGGGNNSRHKTASVVVRSRHVAHPGVIPRITDHDP